jgi:hypothetical protein
MANGPRPCGRPDSAFAFTENEPKRTEGLLGCHEMPSRDPDSLPGLGVQGGKTVLVHQWDHVRRKGPKELEVENENLPVM